MIALIILGIGLFGLACKYWGYKEGLSDGIMVARRTMQEEIDKELDSQFKRVMQETIKKLAKGCEDGTSN